MAAAIRTAHPDATLDVRPGGRGDFLVKHDGKTLWDKRNREQRFPEPAEVLAQLAKH